jgi:hypothetical protein
MGSQASSSVNALAESSKRIVQIVQLLEERRMSFTFCVNKHELLILSGFGLLFQGLGLKKDGKLVRDHQKVIQSISQILERTHAPAGTPFKKFTCSLLAMDSPVPSPDIMLPDRPQPRNNPEPKMLAPPVCSKGPGRRLGTVPPRFPSGNDGRRPKEDYTLTRRSTVPDLTAPQYTRAGSQISISSVQSEPTIRRTSTISSPPQSLPSGEHLNLDYLSFGEDLSPVPSYPPPPVASKPTPSPDWDRLLGYVDTNQNFTECENNYLTPDFFTPSLELPPGDAVQDCSAEMWNMSDNNNGVQNTEQARSVLSFSEESLTSNSEQQSSCDMANREYLGYAVPHMVGENMGGMDTFNTGFPV